MRFSLIICTLDRSTELEALLNSLVRQNRTDFEVILVDQNADDRLIDILRQFSPRFPLRLVRMTGTGLSRARNLGLEHANGDLIGFPDDDCQYLEGYLAAVNEIFTDNPSIGCISGHPLYVNTKELATNWRNSSMDLSAVTVLNRCQEFTVFVRRNSLRDVRYNESLGVGAETLWGADEGPDFLIRLVRNGVRLVYFPFLFVYHPDKVARITTLTLERAASYSRGRGCLFRLHRFPLKTVAESLLRPAAGSLLYLLRCQPMRSAYYLATLTGILRGLFMTKSELEVVRTTRPAGASTIAPMVLAPLSTEPLVSVLVANYNYARFLPAALDSLLAQTYRNWQGIICDDGSTDDSVRVIDQYSQQDCRIEVIRKRNGGQNSAYNACYEKARGEIICLLDADDLFDAGKLQRVVDAFRGNTQAGMCNHFSQVIDSAGNRQAVVMQGFLDSGWLAKKAMTRGACVSVPTTSCMSIRRDIGDILFPVPARQERDLDGYLAMAAQFLAPICVVSEKLASYRIHGENMGGLTSPTPDRLRYELSLISARTCTLKEFVSEQFSESHAARIVLEDNPHYIQAALKLLAIETVDLRPAGALNLIRRHPSWQWRAMWNVMFTVPALLRRNALPWMHSSYRAKAIVHRFFRPGKGGDDMMLDPRFRRARGFRVRQSC